MSGLWLAIWALIAGAAAAPSTPPPPGLVLSRDAWSMALGPAEVETVEVFPAEGGGVALLVTLRDGPAASIARDAPPGRRLALTDPGGAAVSGGFSPTAAAGRILAVFPDAADAQRAARRLLGQE